TLTGYSVILIVDIVNDNPVIQQTMSQAEYLPIPDFFFKMDYKFELFCSALLVDYTTSYDCMSAIKQYPSDQYYYAVFKTNGSFKANLPDGPQNGILVLSFYIIVTDSNFNSSSPGNLVILTADAENSNIDILKNHDYNYLQSIYGINLYGLSYSMFGYTRSIKEVIKKTAWTDFGIPPKHSREPYIITDITTSPLSKFIDVDPTVNVYGVVAVRPKHFFVTVETEQRSKTFISSLALLGGAWSLAAGVYTLCFGTDAQKPWGWAQSWCCFFAPKAKSHFRQTFSVLPLIDRTSDPES
ncbi:10402_t:CDS:2, partial [Ambispora gerdemannii]